MTVILFEPHYDDAVLFASYTLRREKPKVITVLGGDTVQAPGITAWERQRENERAMGVLNVFDVEAWGHSERSPDWDAVADSLRLIRDEVHYSLSDRVFAPLVEQGGHDHHNKVGLLTMEIFGDNVSFYATYRRGSGRTRTDTEVIPEPDWPARKYAAMACFSSQINLENTRPWFCSDDCLREWIA